MENKTLKKKYTICHPVVFAMVMQDEQLCRELLQRILPERKIRDIRFLYEEEDSCEMCAAREHWHGSHVETEKSVIVGIEAKSIRLDVLFEDEDVWYNMEMQMHNTDSPAKRSRYYHAVKTVDSFKQGQKYKDLRPGYVIFICMFDFLGLNQFLYRYEMREEKIFLPLQDGQVTIFLNGQCTGEIPEGLRPFYLYLQNGEVCAEDTFVSRMDAAVREVIQKEEVRYKVNLYDESLRWQNMAAEAQAEAEKAQAEAEKAQAEAEKAQAEAEKAQAELEKVKAEANEARRLNLLIETLLERGRMEDVSSVLHDESSRQKLMEELDI